MRVIENFFFTPIPTANILKLTVLHRLRFEGNLSKQRSPFASEDVLIELSTLTSLQSEDGLNGAQFTA